MHPKCTAHQPARNVRSCGLFCLLLSKGQTGAHTQTFLVRNTVCAGQNGQQQRFHFSLHLAFDFQGLLILLCWLEWPQRSWTLNSKCCCFFLLESLCVTVFRSSSGIKTPYVTTRPFYPHFSRVQRESLWLCVHVLMYWLCIWVKNWYTNHVCRLCEDWCAALIWWRTSHSFHGIREGCHRTVKRKC